MAKRARASVVTARIPVASDKQSLGQQVVSRVLELIRTGNLRPGDRLPPERELIDIFRISRPSLREALRSLSILGVIEARHGGGAFVTDLEPRTLLAPLDFYLSLSQSNLDDAFESRRLVEVEIARKAAMNATPNDVQELRAMIKAHTAVLRDPIGFRILDSRFHERLSLIAGNTILQRIAEGLYNMGLDVRRRATADPVIIAQSTEDHTGIVEAVSERDSKTAGEMMRVHLHHIEDSTRRYATLMAGASRRVDPRQAPSDRDARAGDHRGGRRASATMAGRRTGP